MKTPVKISTKIILLLLFSVGWSNSNAVAQNYPEVTIPDTELRTMQSRILGQELNLFIKLPASYQADGQRIYPVIYATDANRSFTMLSNIFSSVEVPAVDYTDVVLIGIGYKIRSAETPAASFPESL